MAPRDEPLRRWTRAGGAAAATAGGLVLLGRLPTLWLGGEAAVEAMYAGCAVSLLAALLAAAPIALAGGRSGAAARAAMAAMTLRMVVALGLGLLLALSGKFERTALLLWLALSYGVLLTVETWWVVRNA